MSPSSAITTTAGARSCPGRRDKLGILIAKGGFAFDRLQTVVKGGKTAIGRAAGEIGAPRLILLIVLGLCAIGKRAANNEQRERS
jgi:hypothetical protein